MFKLKLKQEPELHFFLRWSVKQFRHDVMVTIFRFVDIYTLNSQNLTAKYLNATYHHSRLMGVSDIYNSVSYTTAQYLSKTYDREII